jgi:hypothetical protein
MKEYLIQQKFEKLLLEVEKLSAEIEHTNPALFEKIKGLTTIGSNLVNIIFGVKL